MKEEKAQVAESAVKSITRRTLLQGASAATVVGMVGGRSLSQTAGGDQASLAASGSADKSKAFPDKFLWGCATAGHQVEGNNTSSDLWLMEHLPGSNFQRAFGRCLRSLPPLSARYKHAGRPGLQHLSLFAGMGAH